VKPKAVIPALVVGLLLIGAASAQAGKWTYGNGESDLEVGSAPRSDGLTGFVCTTRIHGRAGLGRGSLPAPAPPYGPITVEVYTAGPGELDGSTPVTGGLKLADGTTVIPPIATQTVTPTKLNPVEQYEDFSHNPIYEYAAAPFAFSFAAGQITPGNEVLLVQSGHQAYATRTAQTCPDQKTWSGGIWNTVKQGNVTISPASSATKLKFTLGTGGTADPLGLYYTDCTIAGAFTAKVHYTLNTWPAHNGVRVGLLVNNPDFAFTPGSVTAERTSFAASGDVDTGEKYAGNGTDSGGGFVTKPTAATSGDLRVRVASGKYTMEYRDATTAGAWKPINTAPLYPGSVSLGLQVWSGLSLFTGPVKVTLSGFAILKGVCA
jgi:hypothetical protein